MTRFRGLVTDATTGKPVADVCVIIGQFLTCLDNMPHTDTDGIWIADLPIGNGLSWTFNFMKDGYAPAKTTGISDVPGEKRSDVSLQPN